MCSGILYARVCTKSLQSCQTLCDPVDCSLPASLSMGFSRQEYWSGLPFPLQEIFLTQELNLCLLCLPALATGFFPTSAAWEAQWYLTRTLICISVKEWSECIFMGPFFFFLPSLYLLFMCLFKSSDLFLNVLFYDCRILRVLHTFKIHFIYWICNLQIFLLSL